MTKHLSHEAVRWMVFLCSFFLVLTDTHGREIRSINEGWRFLKGECKQASEPTFDDSLWTTVNLPHTWNTDAYTEKDYYRGTGWYRRPLPIPAEWTGKQIFLKLEGASKEATIYINGQQAGIHRGGYTACVINITPYISNKSDVEAALPPKE